MSEDFPTQVCVHIHEIPDAPESQRLPVLVLVSKDKRIVVIEGVPDLGELYSIVKNMLKGE